MLPLTLKFMQRGHDAEVAAKLQQQYVKEVSDQQWHLSIVREVDAVRSLSLPFLFEFLLTQVSQWSSKTKISYEPSYTTFEVRGHPNVDDKNSGRKTFGSIVPDIDVCVQYRSFLITGTHQECTRGASRRRSR